MLTCGRGQRIGLFGGSGVGKSTLLGMLTRGTAADVIVLGAGRRARPRGARLPRARPRRRRGASARSSWSRPRTTRRCCACAPPTPRRRSPSTSAIRGKNVLLLMDSVTRFAMAQREVGLAAGEPPTTKGYPPSVFARAAGAARARRRPCAAGAASPRCTPCSWTATITTSRSPTPCARFSTATSCCRATWRRAITIRRSTCCRASAGRCPT